ncbi:MULTISPECIES: hypothetical protein [unclassified Microcoleus]|uniref:hypothetical protein n=1 Tax=unclassified Microcoleus TaxID=2642155 RepID=UPI002FCF7654
MTPENDMTTPEMAMQELGIKSSQYYARLDKLGIKAKRLKGKAYLDADQMAKLRGYSEPESAIATVDNSSPELVALETVEVVENISDEEEHDIWRRAGEIKAKQLTAKDLLALHLAAGLELRDLDPDLQEQVKAINTAANPDSMGKSIAGTAQAMLQKRRLHQT